MVEQTQQGLLGNISNTLANLSLPGRLGLLSTGVSLLEGQPLGQAVQTGLGAFGGLQQINQQQKQREGIEALKKQYANNPKIRSLLDSNPTAVMNAITAQAFAPKVDASTSLMKNIAFLKEQFPDKSIAELIAMTKQPSNVVNVNSGGDLNNTEFYKDLQKQGSEFLGSYGNMIGNINNLEEALTTLKTDENISGLAQGVTQYFGGDAALKLIYPDTANTKARIESVVQESLKVILGGQFSEKEGENILKRAFDPAASPQENAKRLQVILNKIKLGFEAKKLYFDAFSQGKTPPPLPTLESMGLLEDSSSTIKTIPNNIKILLKDKKPDNINPTDWETMLNNLSLEELAQVLGQ